MDSLKEKSGVKREWLLPLAVAFCGICLLVIGYVLMWVANVALGGAGVANSFIIKSMVGRIIVSLVYTVVLVAAVISLVYLIKMFIAPDKELGSRISTARLLPVCLHAFAVFSLIDAGVIFCFSILGDSVVGFTQAITSSYDVLAQALNFMGYAGLNVKELTKTMTSDGLGVFLSIMFGVLSLAFAIGNVILLGKIKEYYRTLSNTADGSQYDKGNKTPFVLLLVYSALNLALAVISIISGVWVEAVIKLALAVYFIGLAFSFRAIHQQLRLTSID